MDTVVPLPIVPYYRSAGSPLVFTEAAARKVHELIQEEGNPELKLRVYITGGGCSGFQYGFTFDEDFRGVVEVGATALCQGHHRCLVVFFLSGDCRAQGNLRQL